MSAIDELFRDLRAAGKKAFMPFITAADPDLDFTAAVIRELSVRGCHLCELGVPYSDPIADGPVIQASYTRALAQKVKVADILAMVRRVSTQVSMPIVTMVSYAVIFRHGLARYVSEAKAAGIAGAIVPDLIVEESDEFAAVCRREDFSLIQLVTPTTPRERAVRIAERTTGFVYYVSVAGITGERTELPPNLIDNVGWLRRGMPICTDGISADLHRLRDQSAGPRPALARAPCADGLIVGSAIVRRIEKAGHLPRTEVLAEIGDFAAELPALDG